ncbi:RNA polymerase sigma-70 factor [Hymenobacter terrenus]|uniref:RNA polymerase sigma-70 factor n=1 Tax=Hymenobacter terrenus TaxID=1629124 RepID=UPI000907E84D|nr:RNA polymerase sigma-70 factor [Hymenobacter terrenus]
MAPLLTEQNIGEAIRQGNEPAFEAMFRLHYAPLCRYARQLLPDADDAEEAVQATFVTIWEKRATLDVSISFKAYLFRAVHNRCLRRLQHENVRDKHREQVLVTDNGLAASPVETLLGDELASRVQQAIQRLPEKCRLAFTLSRYDELSYAEIADQLNISPKTVENQIGKALRLMREELREYLPFILLWLLSQN